MLFTIHTSGKQLHRSCIETGSHSGPVEQLHLKLDWQSSHNAFVFTWAKLHICHLCLSPNIEHVIIKAQNKTSPIIFLFVFASGLCERPKRLQGLSERPREDRWDAGCGRMASHWRHWEMAAGTSAFFFIYKRHLKKPQWSGLSCFCTL